MSKRKATPATLPADTRNVSARGEEWQAEKLTGNRGQKGNLPGSAAYLALPQIEYKTEWDALDWWKANAEKFPNLLVMARQYLGCPATSATVERLFSQVGIAFSDQRKSAKAETIADILFTRLNVE